MPVRPVPVPSAPSSRLVPRLRRVAAPLAAGALAVSGLGVALAPAAVANPAGNVVGIMPHPERAIEDLLGSSDGRTLLNSLVTA